jgi:predicted Rossmann fold flavoprotein
VRVDAVIIGAGASGLVSAINLAKQGKKVIILERLKKGAKKILASGNGHCNITNAKISSKNYIAKNKELLTTLLQECSSKKVVEFFRELGLEIEAKEDGRMFPSSFVARSVVEILEATIAHLNIKVFYEVEEIDIKKGFVVTFDDKKIVSKNLIIATGSLAAPALGGNDFGLKIAKYFGHSIIKPLPALVPLKSKEPFCRVLNGVKLFVNLKAFVENKEITSLQGDILFREYGVSGLAVLDCSLYIARALDEQKEVFLELDFVPKLKKKELLGFLQNRVDKKRGLSLLLWLGGFIHLKLASVLIKELKLEQKSEKNLTKKDIVAIVEFLKAKRVKIDALREFKYAEVALGGVNSKEIDSKTLESKKQKGLFFVGEVLDITGERGGYNFHFAWCSALRLRID